MKWVWLDHKMVLKSQALIPCFEEGVVYSRGLFETMRCYRGRIFALDQHLSRLVRSCPFFAIKPPSKEILKSAIRSVIKKNGIEDASVRLNISKAFKGSHIFVFAKKLSLPRSLQYEKGFSVVLLTEEKIGLTPLNGLKSFHHYFYQRIFQEAKRRGFDEALFLNSRDEVVEGSRMNLFLVKDRCVLIPALSSGCLPGVTRAMVIQLLKKLKTKIIERPILPRELFVQDEMFVTNSLIEVMPVTRINGRRVGTGEAGELTKTIQGLYKKRVEEECRRS